MSQDAMFFLVTGLIVIALTIIGPGFVVWQYQRGGAVARRDKGPEPLPGVVTSTPSRNPEHL